MIRIDSNDLLSLSAALYAELGRMQAHLNAGWTEAVHHVYADIVMNSPQFTGNLAANWHIGLTEGTEFHDYKSEFSFANDDAYERGDDPAVSISYGRLEQSYRFGQPLVIYNNTPYAEEVDNGRPPPGAQWRAVNLVQGRIYMIMNQIPTWQSRGWSQ